MVRLEIDKDGLTGLSLIPYAINDRASPGLREQGKPIF